MEKKQVYPVWDLVGKFRSKDDLYRLLTQQRKHSTSYHAIHIVHYLLSTCKKCPVRFMKALIAGEKKVNNETVKLSNRLLRNTSYLHCVYLSIQNFLLVKCILSLKMTKQYRSICMIIMKDSNPDQNFFHKLVSSLYQAEMYDLIEKVHKHRAVNVNDRQQEVIEIEEGIAKEINNSIIPLSKLIITSLFSFSQAWKSNISSKEKSQRKKRA